MSKLKKKRYSVIGEGDDFISDWTTPISDYPILLTIINYCESNNISFPLKELSEFLAQNNVAFKIKKGEIIETTQELLLKLLSPWVELDYEQWGGDTPGRSGSYVIARMELGNTKSIREILQKANDFLDEWLQRSASTKGLSKTESVIQQETALIEAKSKSISKKSMHKEGQQFENEIFGSISEAIAKKEVFKYLNYLVYEGVIFVIPWPWYSLPGSLEMVLSMLREAGYPVVECRVERSKRGRIPHWARTKEDEEGLGWNEPGIKVTAPDKWTDLLHRAMKI